MLKSILMLLFGLALAVPVNAQNTLDSNQARMISSRSIALQDADGDGRISRLESDQAPLALFRAIDLNRDGVITEDELLAVTQNDVSALRIANTEDRTRALVSSKFQALDANGDGVVSPPEMAAISRSIFETADINHDGFVSSGELISLAVNRSRH